MAYNRTDFRIVVVAFVALGLFRNGRRIKLYMKKRKK
jgi:hypothetical protein